MLIAGPHWRDSFLSVHRFSRSGRRWSSCGRSRRVCASTRRSLTRFRSASILLPILTRPARSSPADPPEAFPMNQTTNRIAFQGDFGANSDMASRDMFPTMEPLPCPTFEDAFTALETGEADLAMIPIENTIAGRVADIHYLLPESRLHIIGEYFMPIHFQLMVLPGVMREEIRTVHSHIHALGQCRKIIRSNGWKAIVAGDTAGAAKQVAEKGDRSMAALAPRLAAELYGLEILDENVEDTENNVTRFVILSRDENWASRNGDTEIIITTFVFNVRNIPAALYKAMG